MVRRPEPVEIVTVEVTLLVEGIAALFAICIAIRLVAILAGAA